MKNNNYPTWLVPIEIAKELKEIGFDMVCQNWQAYESFVSVNFTYLDRYRKNNYDVTTIPTWEQVFGWFREKKIYGNVNQEWEYGRYNSPIGLNYFYVINDCRKKKINKTKAIVNGGFDNYEEAREELVIEIIRTYKSEQL